MRDIEVSERTVMVAIVIAVALACHGIGLAWQAHRLENELDLQTQRALQSELRQQTYVKQEDRPN